MEAKQYAKSRAGRTGTSSTCSPCLLSSLCLQWCSSHYLYVYLSFHSAKLLANIPGNTSALATTLKCLRPAGSAGRMAHFLFAIIALAFQLSLGILIALLLNRTFTANLTKTTFFADGRSRRLPSAWCGKIYEPSRHTQLHHTRPRRAQDRLAGIDLQRAVFADRGGHLAQWTPMVMLIVLAGSCRRFRRSATSRRWWTARRPFRPPGRSMPLLRPTIYIGGAAQAD